jgi:hypothetical protein
MAISSINFKVVKSNSETHNNRQTSLDYIFPELSKNNSSWSNSSIQNKEKEIASLCKKISGRKLQKNAEPIREAVVNLQPHHTLDDLEGLSILLKDLYGIECFQIHIHKDEGQSQEDLNHHAHMIFDWQDKTTGKTMKLNRIQLSQIQTLVANVLGMERGQLKTNSNRERLEPIEYKRQEEQKKFDILQQQTIALEQKKNEVRARVERLAEEREIDFENSNSEAFRESKEAFRELILDTTSVWTEKTERVLNFSENELNQAIDILKNDISRFEK